MQLESPAFKDGDMLPSRYTANGANTSPPLQWTDPPSNAQAFALLVEDPDASDFLHWAIYNIPAQTHALDENASYVLANSDTVAQAVNDAGSVGYFGPRPPRGQVHRYNFRLLALDVGTDVRAGVSRDDFLKAVEPHVIAESNLTALSNG